MANLANASENDTDLFGDVNALHWAERFAYYFKVVRKDGGPELDVHGLMLAWFAGAIETGRMRELSGILGYKIVGEIYHPDDVTTIRKRRPTKLKENTMPNIIEKFQDIVYDYAMTHLDRTDEYAESHFTTEDVYVVWSVKVLQNWKALMSTNLLDGMYYEVTFNGDKNEIYLDAYKKFENRVIPLLPNDPGYLLKAATEGDDESDEGFAQRMHRIQDGIT